MEAAFLSEMRKALLHSNVTEMIVDRARAKLKELLKTQDFDTEALKSRKLKLERLIANLLDSLENGEAFDSIRDRLASRERELA